MPRTSKGALFSTLQTNQTMRHGPLLTAARQMTTIEERKEVREDKSFHWREYLIEATGLGIFTVSAGVIGTLLFSPMSPIQAFVDGQYLPRALMGIAMGITAILLIYSSWGKRSGAHLNPALTIAFYRLGKVRLMDAMFYISSQFFGAIAGVSLVKLMLGGEFSGPPINGVATVPGPEGWLIAFIAELVISFILMMVVLVTSNDARFAKYTVVFAGLLLVIFVTFESPLSGMSINPARTFGSALVANIWTEIWIYFTAPTLGMLIAAEIYLRRNGAQAILCAKLHHHTSGDCIFNCGYRKLDKSMIRI